MFTLIAHRGACCEAQENTLKSLEMAADLGADVVECDPGLTQDGKLILFHDNDLQRLAGDPRKHSDMTRSEVRESLGKAGLTLTTMEDLENHYRKDAAILFDMKIHPTDEIFFRYLKNLPFRAIAGVHSVSEAKLAVEVLGGENVLAFMPKPEDWEAYGSAGCGNLRLWEHWLGEYTPDLLKAKFPKAQVWIMARDVNNSHPLHCMDGSKESIDKAMAMHADGMLLNDIRMARAYVDSKEAK